jgi:preprotein translocase SecE subunit
MAVSETTPPPQTTPTSLGEKRLFNFYRPEDGHASRAIFGLVLGALLVWGAFSFFEWLPQTWKDPLPHTQDLLGTEFVVSWALIASSVLGISFLYGTFWLVNWPKWVDFLVETEAEMKKVSWASRRQVVTESVVVVATVLILGVYIFLLDTILYQVKTNIPWDSIWDKLF